jgi:hypothetical protein
MTKKIPCVFNSRKMLVEEESKRHPFWLRMMAAFGGVLVTGTGLVWLSEPLNVLHFSMSILLAAVGCCLFQVNSCPDWRVSRRILANFPFLSQYLGCVVFYAAVGILTISSGEFVPRFGLIAFVSGFYLLLLSAANGIYVYLV